MRGSVVSRQFLIMAASVLLFLSVGFIAPSQAQDKIDLFGGYSYLRGSVQVGQVRPLGPGAPCPPSARSRRMSTNPKATPINVTIPFPTGTAGTHFAGVSRQTFTTSAWTTKPSR